MRGVSRPSFMNGNTSTPQIELVVARFNEPLNWLRRVSPRIRITVYDKSGEGEPASAATIALPNIGRESHTYLHHIVNRYQTLTPLTVFCQGKPFDHAFDFHHTLRQLAQASDAQTSEWMEHADDGFRALGHVIDTDDHRGERLFATWSKNEDNRLLDVAGFYRALFDSPAPGEYVFRPGAQFIISADCIQRRPLDFYQRALQLSIEFPDAGHCFERLWPQVFDIANPDLPLLNGRKTVGLKPLRRLAAPTDDK